MIPRVKSIRMYREKGNMTTKEENFFSIMNWYHGTTLLEWKRICEMGVKADFNVGTSLDFGNGFYLSNNQRNTEIYALNTVKYSNNGILEDNIPVVICFEFRPMDFISNGDSPKYFEKYDREFAEFVFDCRLNYELPKLHPYDITAGVMTDTIPTKLMQQYFARQITREEVVLQFMKPTSKKQLCLHKQQQCDTLKPNNVYIVNGEELNANEYRKK